MFPKQNKKTKQKLTCACKSLLFGQASEDAEDDGDVVLEADIHDALRRGSGNVLCGEEQGGQTMCCLLHKSIRTKVHRLALDEDTCCHKEQTDRTKGSDTVMVRFNIEIKLSCITNANDGVHHAALDDRARAKRQLKRARHLDVADVFGKDLVLEERLPTKAQSLDMPVRFP